MQKYLAWNLINVILTLPDFLGRVSILLQGCHGVEEAACHGINEIFGRVTNVYLDAMAQERLVQCAMVQRNCTCHGIIDISSRVKSIYRGTMGYEQLVQCTI